MLCAGIKSTSSAITLSFFPYLQSGGRIITLEGRGFELVQNVSMMVRGIGREQTVGALLYVTQ